MMMTMTTLEKYCNIKFSDNLFCRSHVVPCGEDKHDKRSLFAILRTCPKKNVVSGCLLHDFTLPYIKHHSSFLLFRFCELHFRGKQNKCRTAGDRTWQLGVCLQLCSPLRACMFNSWHWSKVSSISSALYSPYIPSHPSQMSLCSNLSV
jgi:hypothetical protein